jgi:antirestriction protein ArdC
MPSNQSDRCDIYQKTTDHIIKAIEKGAGDFQMPWHHSGNAAEMSLCFGQPPTQ